MRMLLLAVLAALMLASPALALNDDPEGGGPPCYWTWDHRYVCGP